MWVGSWRDKTASTQVHWPVLAKHGTTCEEVLAKTNELEYGKRLAVTTRSQETQSVTDWETTPRGPHLPNPVQEFIRHMDDISLANQCDFNGGKIII